MLDSTFTYAHPVVFYGPHYSCRLIGASYFTRTYATVRLNKTYIVNRQVHLCGNRGWSRLDAIVFLFSLFFSSPLTFVFRIVFVALLLSS